MKCVRLNLTSEVRSMCQHLWCACKNCQITYTTTTTLYNLSEPKSEGKGKKIAKFSHHRGIQLGNFEIAS